MKPHFALPVLFFCGCAELEPFMPKVSFDRIDVLGLDWDDIDADFVFRVENPNPVSVKLARFEYALSFSEVQWLMGDEPDGLELAAGDGSEIALPVTVGFASLYEMVQAVRGQDEIPFGLEGSFGFNTPIGIIDIPYDAGGDFPALRTPVIDFSKVRVSDLALTGATINLDLDVDNDHGSNLWFQDFTYAIDVENTSVASGLIPDFGEVEGATTETLTVPLEVSFVNVGLALYDALTSEDVQVGLMATTDVDTPFGLVPLSVNKAGQVSIK